MKECLFWLFIASVLLNIVLMSYSCTPFIDEKDALMNEMDRMSALKHSCLNRGKTDEYKFWESLENQIIERQLGNGK